MEFLEVATWVTIGKIILIDISLISKPPIYVPAATLRRTEQRDIYRRVYF